MTFGTPSFAEGDVFFTSYVLPQNKCVCVGLNDELKNAIKEFFIEYPKENLPSGTIEILCGGYDEVGSSKISFKKSYGVIDFCVSEHGRNAR